MRYTTTHARTLLTIVAIVVAVATGSMWATGCSKTIEEHPTPPEPTAPSDSTPLTFGPITTSAGLQAILAYLGMWRAYQEAVQIPDPDYALLAQFADGDALMVLTDGLRALRDQGLHGMGEVFPAPRIVAVSPRDEPAEVSIRDCMDTSMSHLVATDAASPYADAPGGRRLCLATVARSGPDWKVTSFGLRAVGTC